MAVKFDIKRIINKNTNKPLYIQNILISINKNIPIMMNPKALAELCKRSVR